MDSACYLRNCTQLTEQAPKVKNKCNVPVTVDADGHLDECELRLFLTSFTDQSISTNSPLGLSELPGSGSGM